MPATERAGALAPLQWQIAEVREVITETPRVKSLALSIPGWPGHRAGQHVDVRLTGEDGYQAQRSYSIASAPEGPGVVLTVERIEDGEVSPYLTIDVRSGDRFELRGPIGGYFVWTASLPGPLLLIAGGSGIAPLMAMTAMITPMTGTSTIKRIHFETFAAASPVPLKSMFTCEIIWAGRPRISSGTESELLQ